PPRGGAEEGSRKRTGRSSLFAPFLQDVSANNVGIVRRVGARWSLIRCVCSRREVQRLSGRSRLRKTASARPFEPRTGTYGSRSVGRGHFGRSQRRRTRAVQIGGQIL